MNSSPAGVSARPQALGGEASAAVVKLIVLVGLCLWAFWPEVVYVVSRAVRDSDWAHALAVPVAVLALVYRRRERLAEGLATGSVWGVVVLVMGFGLYAFSIWPLSFKQLQNVIMLPVLAGALLAVGGRRVAKLCLPMLLLVALAVPIGERMYASLIIRPETYTLSTTRFVLDKLPGVSVERVGPDLLFARGQDTGTIALGEYSRGARLLVASVAVGVFVVFSRVRPVWQVVVMALLAGPIALFCNLVRMFAWGATTIYGGFGPLNGVPRAVSMLASLVLAYVLFALFCVVLDNLVIEVEDEEEDYELEVPEGEGK